VKRLSRKRSVPQEEVSPVSADRQFRQFPGERPASDARQLLEIDDPPKLNRSLSFAILSDFLEPRGEERLQLAWSAWL
jgi:hypothetical protein